MEHQHMFNLIFIKIILYHMICSSSIFVHCSTIYDLKALDGLIHSYVKKKQQEPTFKTGMLYKLSLPKNFSDMEASFVRLRSNSFHLKGANLSSFKIPPSIHTKPYTKRLSLIYKNLGNWSSLYYHLPPNLSLVSPVIGLSIYDASDSLSDKEVHLNFMGNLSISISFSLNNHKEVILKCVTFGANGSVLQVNNMIKPNQCVTRTQGSFGVVAHHGGVGNEEKGEVFIKKFWWVFVIVFIGLVLVVSMWVLIAKVMRRKKIREMEREAENSVCVDSVWIGRSKMPHASMMRTQPALEYGGYVS